MDQSEPTIRPLAAKRNLVHQKWRGQVRQFALQNSGPALQSVLGQMSGQCQVKPELLIDIRIAPCHQHGLLPCTRPGLVAARNLSLRSRGAKRVEITNTGPRQLPKLFDVPARRQRKEMTQRRKLQPVKGGGRKRRGQIRDGFVRVVKRGGFTYAERRFQRSVKPLCAGYHRDVMQPGQIDLALLLACDDIPSQPCRSELGQRAVQRHIVNRIAST